MTRIYLYLAFLICSGLGVAWMLYPSDDVLALMNLKDKEFDSAKSHYEKRLSDGDMTGPVVMPLVKLHLQYGDVDSATSLLERFIELNPNHMEGRKQLGTLYKYSQRPEDFLTNLQEMARLDPTKESLQTLSDLYNFHGQYDDQIKILEQMVKLYPEEPRSYDGLSRLYATRKRFGEAAQTLLSMRSRHPQEMEEDHIGFLINLLFESKRYEEALKEATVWLKESPDLGFTTELARLFRTRGKPEMAWTLLEPWIDRTASNNGLLSEVVQAAAATGRGQRMLDELFGRLGEGELGRQERIYLVELAVAMEQPDSVRFSLEGIDYEQLPESTMTDLITFSVNDKQDEDLPVWLLERVPTEYLDRHPILAAEMAHRADDMEKVDRWLEMASSARNMDDAGRIRLASLMVRIGRKEEGMRRLQQVAHLPTMPEWMLQDLAWFFIRSENIPEGLGLFEKIRPIRNTAGVDYFWGMLATAAGKDDAVLKWVDETPELAEQSFLDLTGIALQVERIELASSLATRLAEHYPGKPSVMMLARVLTEAGQPVLALEQIQTLGELSIAGEEGAVLEAVLIAAWRDKAIPDEEIALFLEQRLRHIDPTPDENLTYATIFMQTGYKDRAEEIFLVLAEGAGPDSDEVNGLIAAMADQPGPETEQWLLAQMSKAKTEKDRKAWQKHLREHAFLLLDKKQVQSATRIFQNLATRLPPDSPEVQQLLYLWGPRPDETALNWIVARAKKARGDKEAAQWLSMLVGAGDAFHASELAAKRLPKAGQGGPILKVYLQALSSLRQGPQMIMAIRKPIPELKDRKKLAQLAKILSGNAKPPEDDPEMMGYLKRLQHLRKNSTLLAQMLRQEIPKAQRPERLADLASLAEGENFPEIAAAAYRRTLTFVPDHEVALKRLGYMAFFDGDWKGVQNYLGRYLRRYDGDYESQFYLAEVLWSWGQKQKADSFYHAALKKIAALKEKPYTVRMTRTRIYQRLENTNEALKGFKQLLKEHPNDKRLRADYVELLLETGRLRAARNVLNMPASVPEAEPLPITGRLPDRRLSPRNQPFPLKSRPPMNRQSHLNMQRLDNAYSG
ncbi:MAG: tetratricopeptide repeat protein [Magnetococcales bacterium]|nr:tetratricopeptide repeat protein [Magnetococcales bacterium]